MPPHEPASERLVRGTVSASIGALSSLTRRLSADAPPPVARDIAYGTLPAQRLDVYAPIPPRSSPAPAVLYLHGGGFQILDKRTHWMFAGELTRAGFTVFMANYRLAPRHPYPAASQDAVSAYRWVEEHAADWDVDAARIVVAGDSAGANLSLGLCLASSHSLDAEHARQMRRLEHAPFAALLFSGLLQVSNARRFATRTAMQRLARQRMRSIERTYAAGHAGDAMLDPLLALEAGLAPAQPIFASVGSADPVADDSLRLGIALAKLRVPHQLEVAEGEGHVFQALTRRPPAQLAWQQCRAFLADLSQPAGATAAARRRSRNR